MTTAPKLIREQLLALADDWDKAADKYKAEASDKTWAVWLRGESSARAAELRACANSLRSLAAEPVGGEIPGWRFDAREDGTIMVVSRSGAVCVVAPDGWKRSVTGHVLYELIRDIESGARPDSAEGDVWPTESEMMDDLDKLRATDEGKGDEYAAEDTVAMDRIFGEQPKAEGDDLAISLAQIAGAKFTLRGEQLPTDVIGVLRMAADALSAAPQPERSSVEMPLAMAVERALGWRENERDQELDDLLSLAMATMAAPQPEQTCPRCEYSPERCECAQPEQPARTDILDMLRDKAAEVRANGQKFGLRSLHDAADTLIEARRLLMDNQQPARDGGRCDLGVGCDESGVCYASAHGCPDRCGRPDDTHQFKNFHRSLCARFGYTHDEIDWRRDLVSLEEHIAKLIPQQADGGAVAPDGYHYVYYYPFNGEEVIVTDSTGGEWNGQKPIRSMPYYYHPPKSPGVGEPGFATRLLNKLDLLHDVELEGSGITEETLGIALLAALGGEK